MYILMNNNIEEIKTAYIQTVNFRVVMNGGNNEKKDNCASYSKYIFFSSSFTDKKQ